MPNTLLNKDPSAMAVALIAFIVISGIPDVCHSRIVPPGIQDYNINHLDNSIDDKPEKTKGEPSWGYSKADGPHTWPRNFPMWCAGQSQSPIDLVSDYAIHLTVSHRSKDHHQESRGPQFGRIGVESAVDVKIGDSVDFGADSGLEVELDEDGLGLEADAGADLSLGDHHSTSAEAVADLEVGQDELSLGAEVAADLSLGDHHFTSAEAAADLEVGKDDISLGAEVAVGFEDDAIDLSLNKESSLEIGASKRVPRSVDQDVEGHDEHDIMEAEEGQILAVASADDMATAMNMNGTLVNNGHNLEFRPVGNKPRMVVNSKILHNQTFELLQIHFHWGSNNKQGSEHTLEGRSFPMEMHAVHRNVKYSPEDDLSKHSDALLVLGFFIDAVSQSSSKNQEMDAEKMHQFTFSPLQPIVNGIQKLEENRSDQVEVTGVNLMGFAKSVRFNQFYHYSGSLTTPPCTEIVSWIVFDTPVVVGDRQIEAFQKFDLLGQATKVNPHPQNNNFRPPQPVNGRDVYHYMPESLTTRVAYILGKQPRSATSRKVSAQENNTRMGSQFGFVTRQCNKFLDCCFDFDCDYCYDYILDYSYDYFCEDYFLYYDY